MKRFTDTAKWDKEWYVELSPLHKLAWIYLCDRADAAGVLSFSRRMANAAIGEAVDWEAFLELCDARIEPLPNGKLWIRSFIPFQYPNGVHPSSKQHSKIRESIANNELPVPLSSAEFA